jgi:hypothetical protein
MTSKRLITSEMLTGEAPGEHRLAQFLLSVF